MPGSSVTGDGSSRRRGAGSRAPWQGGRHFVPRSERHHSRVSSCRGEPGAAGCSRIPRPERTAAPTARVRQASARGFAHPNSWDPHSSSAGETSSALLYREGSRSNLNEQGHRSASVTEPGLTPNSGHCQVRLIATLLQKLQGQTKQVGVRAGEAPPGAGHPAQRLQANWKMPTLATARTNCLAEAKTFQQNGISASIQTAEPQHSCIGGKSSKTCPTGKKTQNCTKTRDQDTHHHFVYHSEELETV